MIRAKFKKVRKRLNITKLKAGWFGGNSTDLMQKVGPLLDVSLTTGGSLYSSRTAAIDLSNALEDYACKDYKCLTLDCLATSCDILATGVAFFPKTKVTGLTFASFSAVSKFSRTLRNKCKQMESGLFGCKN